MLCNLLNDIKSTGKGKKNVIYCLRRCLVHAFKSNRLSTMPRMDYDKEQDAFIIRRTFSNKELVQHTKTKKIHVIPCHSEFRKIMQKMPVHMDSPYFFVHPHGKLEGKHYSLDQVQMITDHARRESVKKHAAVQLDEKRRLMEGNLVVNMKEENKST